MTFNVFIVPRIVANSVSIDEEQARSDARRGPLLQEPAWSAVAVGSVGCRSLEFRCLTLLRLG